MRVANYPDIFQQKMNDLFNVLEFIHAYIDDLLVLTKLDWTDHVQKLELTLNKLKLKGLKCDIENSFFGMTKMGYLGFRAANNVVNPINIKIESITNMNLPTS